MKTSSKKLKKFIFFTIMLSFSLTFCFLLLEFGFGYFYYSGLSNISNTEFDSLLGWRFIPGKYWIKPPSTFKKNCIVINKYGLRNRKIDIESDIGVKRVLVLGDSFTYGDKISSHDIFTSKLEGILNKNSNYEFEVINAGVKGYGNSQELLFMRKLADANIIPDIYLLMIFTNDILDNLRLDYGTLEEQILRPGFVVDTEGNCKLEYLPQKIILNDSGSLVTVEKEDSRLKIIETVRRRIETTMQTKPALVKLINKIGIDLKFPRMPGLLNGWYNKDVLNGGVPLMKALIKEIREEAERNNAQLLVSMIPSPLQVYPNVYGQMLKNTFPNNELVNNWQKDLEKPQNITKEICEQLELPFLDLYPPIYKNNNKELYIPGDGHFTKQGHSIVAYSLADFILKYYH